MKSRGAFTLIELLIVVAIIAILAAIAVPNFLEAQTRSKVSRTRADMRSIAAGLESYRVDNNHYPLTEEPPDKFPGSPFAGIGGGYMAYAGRLSTPIAYMTSQPKDIFDPRGYVGFGWDFYEYWSEPSCGWDIQDVSRGWNAPAVMWVLWSWGPDRDADDWNMNPNSVYDPTNGTISSGNIYRFGP